MSSACPWSEVLKILGSAKITDVLVPAWVERSMSPPRAALSFGKIYLELGEPQGYLEISSVKSHGGLAWSRADSIDLSDQMLQDEIPDDHCVCSLASLYLGEWPKVDCLAVTYVTNEESDLDRGIVRCAELLVSGEQRIFLDPMWTSGVRIGVAGAFGAWMKEYEHGPWTMNQHSWTRPQT